MRLSGSFNLYVVDQITGEAKGMKKYSVTDADLKKGWKLQLSGRFAHTRAYVVELAKQHHFQVRVAR